MVKEDNVSALHLTDNPAPTPNSKHIDIRHHFIWECVARKEFKVVYVLSELHHVDFLTKPLHKETFCIRRNLVTIFFFDASTMTSVSSCLVTVVEFLAT